MPNGQLVVSDGHLDIVCVRSPITGRILRRFGRQGTADAQFAVPTALAYASGELFVLDMSSTRIQVFS